MNRTIITIEKIAEVCHSTNVVYCATIGDFSQPAWGVAPDWQRASAINGVEFHLLNPGSGPEASHESWLRQKEAEGWVYGEKKDPEAKTHPCCVTYARLPADQKAKDRLFIGVVEAMRPLLKPEEVEGLRERVRVAEEAERKRAHDETQVRLRGEEAESERLADEVERKRLQDEEEERQRVEKAAQAAVADQTDEDTEAPKPS